MPRSTGMILSLQAEEKGMQLKKLNDKTIDQLFEAVLTLKTVEECYIFFDDLCTVGEIQSMSQRLEVARMLGQGSTYSQIEAETGASTATISRVKRCLNYGNDGYKLALHRLEK
jgi:TrpR-related protein YerC/YecD